MVTILVCCGIALVGMGVLIFRHEDASRIGRLHLALSLALGGWEFGLAAMVSAPDGATAVARLRYLGLPAGVLVVPILLQLFHALTVHRKRIAAEVIVVWVGTAVVLGLMWLSDEFSTGAYRYDWGYAAAYKWGGSVFAAYVGVVIATCVWWCWRMLRSSLPGSVAVRRARMLIVAAAIAGPALVDFLPFFGVDVFPFGGIFLVIGNAVMVVTTWRYRLVEITPAFAAQRFMDTMSDGVVVLDQDGVVRLVNAAGCTMLGYRAEELLHAVPPAGLGLLLFGPEELPHFPTTGFVGQERQYQTPAGNRRTLSVSVSLMQEGGREPLAAVVTLRDITAALAAQEQIHKLAYYDPLTNLPNRLLLKERFSQAMARAERARSQAAVLFLDLDRFKQVNDTLGHEAGDLLLKAVSERITACVRESDLVMRNAESAKDSTLARLGGDEFVLLLSPVERGEDAAKVARRILQALAQPFRLAGGLEVMSGVSIGISLYPADGEDADTLMKKADLAMYHAKESGRNDFRLFDPAINAHSLKRLDLEAGLKRALRRGELALSWEPQYALAKRSVVGLEAHVWWRDPIRGRLETADFTGVAEETGIAAGIFDWTLEAVCTQIDAWRRSGEMGLPVSVSASLHQIEHSELLRDPAAVLAAHGLPSTALRLCVSDLAASDGGPIVLARLAQLDALGIAVDLDSLGSGPLDLPKLRQVPVRRVRIDARLVERLAERGDPARPLQALVSLARGLGLAMAVTAVASEKIAALFAVAGVEHAQGPLYGSAVEAGDVPRLVSAAPSG